MGDLDGVRCGLSNYARVPPPAKVAQSSPIAKSAPVPSEQINNYIYKGRHLLSTTELDKIRAKQDELYRLYDRKVYLLIEDRVPRNIASYYGFTINSTHGLIVLAVSPSSNNWQMIVRTRDKAQSAQLRKALVRTFGFFNAKKWGPGFLFLLQEVEEIFPTTIPQESPAPVASALEAPTAATTPSCTEPDAPARIIDRATPEPHRWTAGIHQFVRVGVTLDEHGAVVGSPVVLSAANAMLIAEAMATASRSQFAPATSQCNGVRSQFTFVISF